MALYIFVLSSFSIFTACTVDESVREYFESHGMEYPADVSGIAVMGIGYAGIQRDELLAPGAREFIGEGVFFIKEYLGRQDLNTLMPGIEVEAIIAKKPVVFRGESGKVGLMVKVTGYGTGAPDSRTKLEAEFVGKDRRFWKVENFVYFVRNDLYRWQFGGWVY